MPAELEAARIARPRLAWGLLRKLKRILWLRKIYHVVCGMACIGLALWLPPRLLLPVAAGCLFACSCVELWRRGDPRFHQQFMAVGTGFLRPQERYRPTGTVWTCLAMTCITGVLSFTAPAQQTLLVAGCLVGWTFGDPAAEIVGRLIPSQRIRKGKSLAGTTTCLVVSFIAFAVFFHLCEQSNIWALSLVGAAATTLAELLTVSPADDNLTIPVLSALVLSFFV